MESVRWLTPAKASSALVGADHRLLRRWPVRAILSAALAIAAASTGQVQAQALSAAQEALKAQFKQIDEGFRVFKNETFEGNGRTCATCHIPSEAYNIFPATIKELSKKEKDVLLVTSVPGLENPELVKQRALFNISGGNLSDARATHLFGTAGGPIFRSTMAIAGLAVTTVNTAGEGTPLLPPACSVGVAAGLPQLGWAGDGSPGTPNGTVDSQCRTHHGNIDANADGSIRAFANGAIAQHAPASLKRIAKTTACPTLSVDKPNAKCNQPYDFRFASNAELDALDAFQKWLGRRALSAEELTANPGIGDAAFDNSEIVLTKLAFADARINLGRDHFIGPAEIAPGPVNPNFGAGCTGCHVNAGAKFVNAPLPAARQNININSRVELGSPAVGIAVVGVALPHDEGAFDTLLNTPPLEGFNIQSAIEGARKKAWFHNHRVVDDFEQSIAFYGTNDFISGAVARTTLAGLQNGNNGGGTTAFKFPAGDGIQHIGAFLRTLSAYYGVRDCERLLNEAIARIGVGAQENLPVKHCRFNLADVSRVLKESKLSPLPYKDVAEQARAIRAKLPEEKCTVAGLQSILTELAALKKAIATINL